MINSFTLQPLPENALDDYLANMVKDVLSRLLSDIQPGQCLRADELPPEVIRRVAEVLHHTAPMGVTVAVLHDQDDYDPATLPPYKISMGRAVELRNNPNCKLLLLVPPVLRAGAIDSLGTSTFMVIDTVRREPLLVNALRELRAEAKAAGSLAEVVDIALDKIFGGDIADDDRLRYYLTLRANGWHEAAVGGALYCFGLFPDFNLPTAQPLGRLKQNEAACKQGRDADATPFQSIHHIAMRDNATPSELYKLVASYHQDNSWSEGWMNAMAAIATNPQYHHLAINEWLPSPDAGVRPILYLAPLKAKELVTRNDGTGDREFHLQQDKAEINVSWSSKPPPKDCPNVTYYMLELVDESNNVYWKSAHLARGNQARRRGKVRLDKSKLDEELYYVRVSAYDSNDNPINDVEAHDDDSRLFNLSDGFWLKFDIGDNEDSEAGETRRAKPFNVASYAEALLLTGSVQDEASSQVDVAGGQAQLRFGDNATRTYAVRFSPLLYHLEQAMLAQPQLTSDWRLRQQGGSFTIVVPTTTIELPLTLLTTRRTLCTALLKAGEECIGGGLTVATDLHLLANEINYYLAEYNRWLASLLTDSTTEQIRMALSLDVVEIETEAGAALLLAPTHPLLLGWQSERLHMVRDWLSQKSGIRGDAEETRAGKEMKELLQNLVPRNLPLLLERSAGEWLGQSDTLAGGWLLYLPLDQEHRSHIRRMLITLGVDNPISDSPAELTRLLGDYLSQHPYVTTLKLNVFGEEGSAQWLAAAIAQLRDNRQLANLQPLRYDIRLFSDGAQAMEVGGALKQLYNFVGTNDGAISMLRTTGILPSIRISRHLRADFADQPLHFEAHVSIMMESLSVAANLSATLPSGRSNYIMGLVQQTAVAYDRPAEGYRWRRQLQQAGQPDLISHTLTHLTTLQARHSENSDDLRPTISLQLDADSLYNRYLNQIHATADWVLTLDRNLGLEYFDGHLQTEAHPIYLLAFTPPFLGSADGYMMLTTQVATEVASVLRRMIRKLDNTLDDTAAPLFLNILRSLSGQLALRLLGYQQSAAEVAGLVLARLYLEQAGLLQNRLLIPLDAHPELLVNDQETPALRGDLLLVEPDPQHRLLRFHVVEVKYRTNNISLADRQHILEQIRNTRSYLSNRFTYDRNRPDHLLRMRELITLLEFYLDRANRYKLVDEALVSRIRPFLHSLDAGYKLEFVPSGSSLIFSAQAEGHSSQHDEIGFIWHGKDDVHRLIANATTGLSASPLVEHFAAQPVVTYFTTGQIPLSNETSNLPVPMEHTFAPEAETDPGMASPPQSKQDAPQADYPTTSIISTVGADESLPYISSGSDVPIDDLVTFHNASAEVDKTLGQAQLMDARPPSTLSMPENPVPTFLLDTIMDVKLREEMQEIARSFLRAARSYHINVLECDPNRAVAGPSVLRFYIRLAKGQALEPLRRALEDISREMRRERLLVSRPAPDSDEVALDVPRASRVFVPLLPALGQFPAISSIEQMPLALGLTPEGLPIIRDLATMPHMLVGGTTGAGKTMFLYTILCSLLHTHRAAGSIRLLVSSAKAADFVFFKGLPQLEQGGVITKPEQMIELLNTLMDKETERRGTILEQALCRDIGEYNRIHQPQMSPIVIIIDEFADLSDQLIDRKQRQSFLQLVKRIAQKGRSAGIHLVVCTQRPSVNAVLGDIRALFNTRVALRVNDAISSRMILEETGAEQLQKYGDILFKDDTGVLRLQGYMLTTQELRQFISGLTLS